MCAYASDSTLNWRIMEAHALRHVIFFSFSLSSGILGVSKSNTDDCFGLEKKIFHRVQFRLF